MECPACHNPNSDGARFCLKCGALLPSAAEEADPLIGTIVGGRFRITDVLGEGGMGRVYTGEQQMGTSVRKVAVKTLLAQFARDPQVLARFMRECGTVSELEHPNTIKVYDFGQTNTGELYIAMELLSGQSLETALEKGAIAPERVDRIVHQICGSLQEAHEKGIVHRDLKPANIYLTVRAGEGDYVKVLDFGIAKRDEKHSKQEQKLTRQGTVLGTPPYMSPEQFRGVELDSRSDIYSLGVMTYEMLTGRLPFDADTPWAWATQHMTAQPFPFEIVPAGSGIPPQMRSAVMRALAKNKEERQETVRAFYDELTVESIRPRVSPTKPPELGTVTMPGPYASSGSQTQHGEPLFVQPGQYRTEAGFSTGSNPRMPTGATARIATGSNPAMMLQPGLVPPHQQVPTGSAQAFPTMAPRAKSSSAAPIVGGILGVLALGGIVTAVVVLNRGPATDSVDAGAPLAQGTSKATVLTKDPTSPGAGGPTATPTVVIPTAPTTTALPPVIQKPSLDPHAEQECRSAQSLATSNNIAMAVHHYRSCEGPDKVGARIAIDQAAQRSATLPGCAGMRDAAIAAEIGATSALSTLRARRCR